MVNINYLKNLLEFLSKDAVLKYLINYDLTFLKTGEQPHIKPFVVQGFLCLIIVNYLNFKLSLSFISPTSYFLGLTGITAKGRKFHRLIMNNNLFRLSC